MNRSFLVSFFEGVLADSEEVFNFFGVDNASVSVDRFNVEEVDSISPFEKR